MDYPDSGNDDDSDDGVRLISSKPAPMTIGDSADKASAVVGAEAWASAGTTAVVAATEASAGIAVAGLEPGAEPETTLVNLAHAPANTAQRTRLAKAVTPKNTQKKSNRKNITKRSYKLPQNETKREPGWGQIGKTIFHLWFSRAGETLISNRRTLFC